MLVPRVAALAIVLAAVSGGKAHASQVQNYDDRHFTNYDVVAAPLTPPQAPADEYFGRFKLSNLGVRNIIHDIDIEGNSPLALPKQQARISAAGLAMIDWADKYPRDRWLPSAIISFAQLLQSKGQAFYDQSAVDLLFYASNRYAGNRYGNQALQLLRNYAQTPDYEQTDPLDLGSAFAEYDFPQIKRQALR
jgi:hypothetical protein